MILDNVRWLIWLLLSMFAVLARSTVVVYNALRILIDLIAFFTLRYLKRAFVFLSWWTTPFGFIREIRKSRLRAAMHAATTAVEFNLYASKLGRLEGFHRWQTMDSSEVCNLPLLRDIISRLNSAMRQRDDHTILNCLRTAIDRKFGGIHSSALYKRSPIGTKMAIHDFMATIREAAMHVCHSKHLRDADKAKFFDFQKLVLGRTALCLSGGGSLSMYHMGVVKALLEAKLLPRVISGTSGGSIVAAMLAMKTDKELLEDIIRDDISERFGVRWFEPLSKQVSDSPSHGHRPGPCVYTVLLCGAAPNLCFQHLSIGAAAYAGQ